ncbi:MAG TPA: GNAT family N-acetyltransferase [Rhizomicrobium sp.]|nr:GNAT family N-acetyltransferase [Rhizomicrobium sp.]
MSVPDNFRDNAARRRFELEESELIAFANYRRHGRTLVIPHVESPPPLRGKGTADRLMRALASHARAQGFTVAPLCGYARAWFRRHPGEADVLAPER